MSTCRPLVILLIWVGLVGCAKQSYQDSSDALIDAERLNSFSALFKFWVPKGQSYSYDLSDAEKKLRDKDILECVTSFEQMNRAMPNTSTRAAELTQCMNNREWQFQTEEVIVTQ